jgi:nucleotide-binding universal stress UspA family protein
MLHHPHVEGGRVSLLYIAGYDASPASRRAVALTVTLARAEGATVAVAHVHGDVPPLYVEVGVDAGLELHDEMRRQGEELLAALDADGVDERILLGGTPARALHGLAEERGASLLAVGLTHREGLDRLVTGSVPAALLHGSPCPVLTVPAGAPAGPPRTIAVAYDGGAEARRALETAARLAGALGAELLLLGCFESPGLAGPALGGGLDVEPDLQTAFERVIEQGAAGVGQVEVHTRMLVGGAGHEIVEASKEGVDLLVTGSRSYGPLRSVVVGSVSRHLVDHAGCPVLVIPRSAEADVDREPSADE